MVSDGKNEIENIEEAGELMGKIVFEQLAGASATEEDLNRLERWFEKNPDSRKTLARLNDPSQRQEGWDRYTEIKTNETNPAYRELLQRIGRPVPKIAGRKLWLASGIAASLILVFAGYYIYQQNRHPVLIPAGSLRVADLAPGRNRALLTLANGTTVDLDNVAAGARVAAQGSANIQKTGQGSLAYETDPKGISAPAQLNTLKTPLGGRYQLRLPDGSKVWLNAGSSLQYPVTFAGLKERTVELSGEAYFEIKDEPQHPFIVRTNHEQIQVLGTHFDVQSYSDEPVHATTLLEGSVKVIAEQDQRMLKPGNQARLKPDGKFRVTEQANLEEAVAWKNDVFDFDGQDLPTIMRSIGRWYDVTIQYDGTSPVDLFTGNISRNLPVSQVLQFLEETGEVKFVIDGKKIIVKKANPIDKK